MNCMNEKYLVVVDDDDDNEVCAKKKTQKILGLLTDIKMIVFI